MDIQYARANEILNDFSKRKLITDFELQELLKSEFGFETLDEMAPEHTYYRNGVDYPISLNELEEVLSDMVITANRWKDLNSESDDITVDMVVDSVISKIAMFNSIIIHNLFTHKPVHK